ncbi:uncharacterized protein N7458_009007 [Penicillium daleae]|uniref:ABM domain-containing protein n=1 Tax=Penicillium daleae TaxID=63821 RepID=A0AAD6BYX7_9EURO|nr:uncharacterized protein N7458_009007 [Penicillium daleae]KAJ5438009.1 hypothetical protein N7458_009007 [Penicillium daleae]
MASESGFSLHVTVYIDPANLPKFFEYLKPVYDTVIAEPECRFFELYQSPEDPGTLRWVEDWTMSTQDFMQLGNVLMASLQGSIQSVAVVACRVGIHYLV